MSQGKLYVFSGPSGVGKGTIVSRLVSENDGIWKSVSATTREPRDGEIEGRDYYFMDRSDFQDLANDGGFLEWAEYAGNLYGTPGGSVRRHLDEGEDVILEIDVQGAFQIREKVPEAVLVFIEPPSIDELERRLRTRGSENEATIKSRMDAAEVELSRKMEYDKRFVNDNIDETVDEIACFILGTANPTD